MQIWYMHMYGYIYIYVCIHIYIYLFIYLFICLFMFVYLYIHTYMHAYIHTYIHTYFVERHIHWRSKPTALPFSPNPKTSADFCRLPCNGPLSRSTDPQSCSYRCILIYMHACMHACIHTYTHVRVCVCTYVCMYVCMCVCLYAYIHTYIHTYTVHIQYILATCTSQKLCLPALPPPRDAIS